MRVLSNVNFFKFFFHVILFKRLIYSILFCFLYQILNLISVFDRFLCIFLNILADNMNKVKLNMSFSSFQKWIPVFVCFFFIFLSNASYNHCNISLIEKQMSRDFEEDSQNIVDYDESDLETIDHFINSPFVFALTQTKVSSVFFYSLFETLFSLKIQSPPPKY
jgi:hypothetical protein